MVGTYVPQQAAAANAHAVRAAGLIRWATDSYRTSIGRSA